LENKLEISRNTNALSPFGEVILMKALRSETTMVAIKRYVTKILGTQFVQPPPFDLEGAYNDSTPITPVVFVLSTGADPMSFLMKLGKYDKTRSL
jgi:dynein heavy chain